MRCSRLFSCIPLGFTSFNPRRFATAPVGLLKGLRPLKLPRSRHSASEPLAADSDMWPAGPHPVGIITLFSPLSTAGGGMCGARGLRSAQGRSTPSSPPSGSSAERTASRRVPPTHMPWAAIPLGRHTSLPPAVIPTDSLIPCFKPVIPDSLLRHARPRPGISILLYKLCRYFRQYFASLGFIG